MAALGVGLMLGVAEAEGPLPPQSYNYLHPPPALAGVNRPPQSGAGIVSLQSGRSPAVFAFTRDGQAGISAPPGAFRVDSGTTSTRAGRGPASGIRGGVHRNAHAAR
jgi:hypothetical protein